MPYWFLIEMHPAGLKSQQLAMSGNVSYKSVLVFGAKSGDEIYSSLLLLYLCS